MRKNTVGAGATLFFRKSRTYKLIRTSYWLLIYDSDRSVASQTHTRKGEMASKENSELAESYPMSGGDGPHSYFHHSMYQKGGVEDGNKIIKEEIKEKFDINKLSFDNSMPFCIADFGCSIGPNTFNAVENIIEAVELKYRADQENHASLEFQVFFNDHSNSDFNTLFKNFHLNHSSKFFAAGVPGAFHNRLFPKSTLHFGYSSYALHWLSKIPKDLVDPKSPAWNKDSIHCTGFHKEVLKAYSTQFKNDVLTFLNQRAQEFVRGGFIAIIVPSLPDGVLMSQNGFGRNYDLLGSCLMDMAKLGLISEENVEAFNLPIYHTSFEEMKNLVEENQYFSIERIDRMPRPMPTIPPVQYFASQVRAIVEEVVKKQFGKEILDYLFEYFTKKLSENFFLADEKNHNYMDIFILLKRNNNVCSN